MGNSFNISVAPEIAAVSALITTVDTVVDAIRATDFPVTDGLIVSEHVTTDALIVSEHVITDGLIAALPTEFRGEYELLECGTTNNAYEEKLNLTGSGKLYWIQGFGHATSILNLKVTIDGNAYTCSHITQTNKWVIPVLNAQDSGLDKHFVFVAEAINVKAMLNIEYKTDLKIEMNNTTGAVEVLLKVLYGED
jgi:hypothetical protein